MRFALVWLLGLSLAIACSTKSQQACLPGAQVSCACPSGVSGVQICDETGHKYLGCQCSSSSIGGSGGSSSSGSSGGGPTQSPHSVGSPVVGSDGSIQCPPQTCRGIDGLCYGPCASGHCTISPSGTCSPPSVSGQVFCCEAGQATGGSSAGSTSGSSSPCGEGRWLVSLGTIPACGDCAAGPFSDTLTISGSSVTDTLGFGFQFDPSTCLATHQDALGGSCGDKTETIKVDLEAQTCTTSEILCSNVTNPSATCSVCDPVPCRVRLDVDAGPIKCGYMLGSGCCESAGGGPCSPSPNCVSCRSTACYDPSKYTCCPLVENSICPIDLPNCELRPNSNGNNVCCSTTMCSDGAPP
jgi:hypothetical protein